MDISDRQDLSTASHAIGESSGSSGVHHSSQAARQQLQMQQLSDQKESKIGQVVNNKGGFEINRSKAPTSQTSGSEFSSCIIIFLFLIPFFFSFLLFL